MTITKNLDGTKLTLALEGRLDTTTSPALEKELETCLAGIKDLVFDFAGLVYISSAGLRVLLSTQKTLYANGSLKLVNVNDVVKEILDVTGFCDILTIE